MKLKDIVIDAIKRSLLHNEPCDDCCQLLSECDCNKKMDCEAEKEDEVEK